MKKTCFIFALVLAVTLPSVSFAKKIPYNARQSAKFSLGTNNEAISIRQFAGNDGAEFSITLQTYLQNAELDGKPVLNISDDRPAVVFEGNVLDARVNYTDYVKTNKVCVESGEKWYQCNRYEETRIGCRKFLGTYTVAVKATHSATKRVIFSQNVQNQGEFAQCDDGDGEKTKYTVTNPAHTVEIYDGTSTPVELLTALRKRSAHTIRELVAPYNITVFVEFMKGTKGIAKESMEAYKGGMAFIEAGRLDRGCSMLERVHETESNQQSVVLNYNLGACDEALFPDDPTQAQAHYNSADQLLTRPDKEVTAALQRMNERVRQFQRIP